jgi:hypothetical protein
MDFCNMALFGGAVKFINGRKKASEPLLNSESVECKSVRADSSLEFDFSLRNYVKESFSVLIVNPISRYMLKILHGTSFVISGIMSGALIAIIFCIVLLQFNSVENSVISSFIISKLEKIFSDADLSIKMATMDWNRESNSMEINLKKVRINDFVIPRVSLIPNYTESFKQQKFVVDAVHIVKPKIAIDVANEFKTVTFNPNFEKGNTNKVFFEPLSNLVDLGKVFERDDLKIKLINADVSVSENGIVWEFKDFYCEHNLRDAFPKVINFSSVFPGQKYASHIEAKRYDTAENKSVINLKLGSVNPAAIYSAFAKRNVSVEKFMAFIEGYNLPVSGDLKLNFDSGELSELKFDLIASNGCIRLPNKNTLSLNIGKRIDNGSVSGSIFRDKAVIDSINIQYGNSGLRLTGMVAPLGEYKFLDVVNIDGTLSLTNIDIKEMKSILPANIAKSVLPSFKTYLPGFKLELFKVDLDGAIVFGNRMNGEKIKIGHGIFKINDAKIPLGQHLVTKVNATGNITPNGIDIKLSNALFGKTKINSGVFFLSNIDNSWTGNVNVEVAIDDISKYTKDISKKLSLLPIKKLAIKGLANLDMKLVHIAGNKSYQKDFPFKIVKGDGVIKSDDNTKNLKFSWDKNKLSVVGDVITGANTIHMKIDENLNGSGVAKYKFIGNSKFLFDFLPGSLRFFNGNFSADISGSWENGVENFDISMNLKDSRISIAALGDIKSAKEDGIFKSHITVLDDRTIYSKLLLSTKNTKISGQISTDKLGKITECVLDNFNVNGCSAKINSLKKNDDHFIASIIGDSIDMNRIIYALNHIDENIKLTMYLNLKSLGLSSFDKIKNVKGTIDILNGKIIGGSCIGVMGENTTLALTAKDINGTSDSLLSLSASDAGIFLKHIGITDTVKGGNISIVIKSDKKSNQSLSGAFEIKDFLVKNNSNLTKLISLSSTNWLPASGDFITGFNSCVGNIIATKENVKIDRCVAISPTISISLEGVYDRLNDELDAHGILLPMSSVINNQNHNGSLAANYRLSGLLSMPATSVDALRFISNDVLLNEFGNALPIQTPDFGYVNNDIDLSNSVDESKDIFSQQTFDRNIHNIKRTVEKSGADNVKVSKKYGVTIKRGIGN